MRNWDISQLVVGEGGTERATEVLKDQLRVCCCT